MLGAQTNVNQTTGGPPIQTTWIIWGAMIFSLVPNLLVGEIGRPAPEAVDATQAEKLLSPIIILGVIISMFCLTFLKRFMKSSPYIVYCIVRWAGAESIAIFGLLLSFLGAPPICLRLMVGWSALLFLLQRPTKEDAASFLNQGP